MEENSAKIACPHCGNMQAEGTRYCYHCGMELTPAPKGKLWPPLLTCFGIFLAGLAVFLLTA